jgi:heme exporter protein C
MRTKILGILTLVSMLAAFYAIFIYAPNVQDQGLVGRIVLIHVPIAILGLLFVVPVFVGTLMFLIKRDLKWDRFAYSSAELALLLITLTLVTGMIWAKPIWGAWWVWDARLTLELVLWLTFIGYFMLRAYLPDREKKAKLSSIFGLLAMINAPINYTAIRWARTQHPQPIIMGEEGSGMDPQIAFAFNISFLAFTLLFLYLLDRRLQIARVEDDVAELESVVLAQ